jgi:hypothetical protein
MAEADVEPGAAPDGVVRPIDVQDSEPGRLDRKLQTLARLLFAHSSEVFGRDVDAHVEDSRTAIPFDPDVRNLDIDGRAVASTVEDPELVKRPPVWESAPK